jgi:hypothetical protein
MAPGHGVRRCRGVLAAADRGRATVPGTGHGATPPTPRCAAVDPIGPSRPKAWFAERVFEALEPVPYRAKWAQLLARVYDWAHPSWSAQMSD